MINHSQTLDDRWHKPEKTQAWDKKNNKNYLNSFGIGNNMISSAIQCE